MNNLLNALVIKEEAVFNEFSNSALADKSLKVEIELNSGKSAICSRMHEPSKKENGVAKHIGMFIAAPFIALGFVIALPFIGLYYFAKLAIEAYVNKNAVAGEKLKKTAIALKNVGLFFASPFVALGYVIALPFVGFFMITKLAMEAHAKRRYIDA